jgi:MOSC domain-containing protein YiiM
VAVARREGHYISKPTVDAIRLLAGRGVEGDAHCGPEVKHRSRVRRDPTQPNLRQVHLIHEELHDELREQGFELAPGEMGENVTTGGLDLLSLPSGTRLRLGAEAVVEVTGLRDPCSQLDGLAEGLMKATLDRDENGELIRKTGIMSIVLEDGEVKPGDSIEVELPAEPHVPLQVV